MHASLTLSIQMFSLLLKLVDYSNKKGHFSTHYVVATIGTYLGSQGEMFMV